MDGRGLNVARTGEMGPRLPKGRGRITVRCRFKKLSGDQGILVTDVPPWNYQSEQEKIPAVQKPKAGRRDWKFLSG